MTRAAARPVPIEVVTYRPRRALSAAVETLTLAELRGRAHADHLAAPQRLEFLLLMLYARGRGEHGVDFVTHRVGAGTLIVVPPGSVHRMRLLPAMDARLLVADAGALWPARTVGEIAALHEWPHCLQLGADDTQAFGAACSALAADAERMAPTASLLALARLRLHTLLMQLQLSWQRAPPRDGPEPAAKALTREFRRLIEQHHMQRWPVLRYAGKLGFAEKTLVRACLASNGLTPKAWIDARVLLEAKRLLVHGGDNVQAVALRLGFESSSPFVRFFRRLDGRTPLDFSRTVLR